MKLFKKLLLAALLASLTACAHSRKIVLEPIGPRETGQTSESHGLLVVYSAWERLNLGDPNHPHHTPYRIITKDGEFVAAISNYRGGPVEEPIPITLTSGAYELSAEGPGGTRLSVPVVIRGGQTTNVYLDGTTRPRNIESARVDLVRLPGGAIAG